MRRLKSELYSQQQRLSYKATVAMCTSHRLRLSPPLLVARCSISRPADSLLTTTSFRMSFINSVCFPQRENGKASRDGV